MVTIYNEVDLLCQFNLMKDHGTRVIIFNLWKDDQGQLELDFDADPHDIQIKGVNRDEKNIHMAKEFPNSRHFLTYRHSVRSHASILYMRLPPGFRIILRGNDIVHHNIVNDIMMSQEVTYKPQSVADGIPKDSNVCALNFKFNLPNLFINVISYRSCDRWLLLLLKKERNPQN